MTMLDHQTVRGPRLVEAVQTCLMLLAEVDICFESVDRCLRQDHDRRLHTLDPPHLRSLGCDDNLRMRVDHPGHFAPFPSTSRERGKDFLACYDEGRQLGNSNGMVPKFAIFTSS